MKTLKVMCPFGYFDIVLDDSIEHDRIHVSEDMADELEEYLYYEKNCMPENFMKKLYVTTMGAFERKKQEIKSLIGG